MGSRSHCVRPCRATVLKSRCKRTVTQTPLMCDRRRKPHAYAAPQSVNAPAQFNLPSDVTIDHIRTMTSSWNLPAHGPGLELMLIRVSLFEHRHVHARTCISARNYAVGRSSVFRPCGRSAPLPCTPLCPFRIDL